MNLKSTILPVLLVSLFIAGSAAGQPANNTSAMDNVSNLASLAALDNETAPGNATAAGNGTAAGNATAPGEQTKLKGMWSITGIESGPISMALNQVGEEVFGRAKFEPDSGQAWNADVVGSMTGDQAELTLSALTGKESVTTRISGVFANESINGSFSQVSGGKIVNKGNFTATWIFEETSSYAPAVIEQPKPVEPSPAETANANNNANQTQKSRFVDVHQYADKIGPGGDLSGIPPGMGGAAGTGI